MKNSLLRKLSFFSLVVLSFLSALPSEASFLDDPTKVVTEGVYDGNTLVGEVVLPNWDEISLSDFPPTLQGGSIGNEYNKYVGYDLSRTWFPGDNLASFMKLGDFEQSFAFQDLEIEEILDLSGFQADEVLLSSFALVGDQTLAELVTAIPSLGSKQVSTVEPVSDLLEEKGYSLDGWTFDALVSFSSPVSELKLNEINLDGYSIDEIPGLEDAELGDFERWENAYIEEAGTLSQVPLSKVPNPLSNVSLPVMRVDAVYGEAEGNRNNTVSGSYNDGFSVSCGSGCSYVELDDFENSGSGTRFFTEGKQWISGNDPSNGNICPNNPWGVNGGHGVLGNVNCGKEPTGRHPFGKVFKMAVWGTDETTDQLETAIFFRFCFKTPFVDLGCTPFFIGPVPFFPYRVNDWIILGL